MHQGERAQRSQNWANEGERCGTILSTDTRESRGRGVAGVRRRREGGSYQKPKRLALFSWIPRFIVVACARGSYGDGNAVPRSYKHPLGVTMEHVAGPVVIVQRGILAVALVLDVMVSFMTDAVWEG